MKKRLGVIIMVLGVVLLSACGKVAEEEIKLVEGVEIDEFGVLRYLPDKNVLLDVKGLEIDVEDVLIVPINENFNESYLKYGMYITNNTKDYVNYEVGKIKLKTGEGSKHELEYPLASSEKGIPGITVKYDDEEPEEVESAIDLMPGDMVYVELLWVIEEGYEEGIYENFKEFTVTFVDANEKESAKIKYKL